jgi:hypothetical protein
VIWGEGSNVSVARPPGPLAGMAGAIFSVSPELWREGSRQNCSMRLNYAAEDSTYVSHEPQQKRDLILDVFSAVDILYVSLDGGKCGRVAEGDFMPRGRKWRRRFSSRRFQ